MLFAIGSLTGRFFDWHQDGEYSRPDGAVSKFTFMIYLNDVTDGGGTTFADVFSPHVFGDFTIKPAVGKALMFQHRLSHRGDPISSGEKYVLRSDVMFQGNNEGRHCLRRGTKRPLKVRT